MLQVKNNDNNRKLELTLAGSLRSYDMASSKVHVDSKGNISNKNDKKSESCLDMIDIVKAQKKKLKRQHQPQTKK